MSGLGYISSAGLRVLLKAAKQAQTAKQKLLLAGLQPSVKQVFEISGFSTLFATFANREDALGKPAVTVMLTFAEELLLLAHDEKSGNFANIQDLLMNTALAGAVLMDLAILNRLDTDVSNLVILDRSPTGEKLLDYALNRAGCAPEP